MFYFEEPREHYLCQQQRQEETDVILKTDGDEGTIRVHSFIIFGHSSKFKGQIDNLKRNSEIVEGHVILPLVTNVSIETLTRVLLKVYLNNGNFKDTPGCKDLLSELGIPENSVYNRGGKSTLEMMGPNRLIRYSKAGKDYLLKGNGDMEEMMEARNASTRDDLIQVKCTKCKESMTSETEFLEHLQVCGEEAGFGWELLDEADADDALKCSVCQEQLPASFQRQGAKVPASPDESRIPVASPLKSNFVCQSCNTTENSTTVDDRCICQACFEIFPYGDQGHAESCGGEIAPVAPEIDIEKCEISGCGKEFSTEHGLLQHTDREHGLKLLKDFTLLPRRECLCRHRLCSGKRSKPVEILRIFLDIAWKCKERQKKKKEALKGQGEVQVVRGVKRASSEAPSGNKRKQVSAPSTKAMAHAKNSNP